MITPDKSFPAIIYGTAWKEDRTEQLVTTAIRKGFRALDTANQRKHYYEAGVGNAIEKSIAGGLKRSSLFVQTKFTSIDGQDNRLPYDPKADIETQVRQSLESSLEHLKLNVIDSYILHGPTTGRGLAETDWKIWHEMETIHREGLVKHIGISNVNLNQLRLLCEKASIKPAFVQNRCFSQLGWDRNIRIYCTENNIIYQGFSLLTANPFVFFLLKNMSREVGRTPAQLVFRFARQVGMIPLTGTTSPKHMSEDLDLDFDLDAVQINEIENIATQLR